MGIKLSNHKPDYHLHVLFEGEKAWSSTSMYQCSTGRFILFCILLLEVMFVSNWTFYLFIG
jgi:hypothetical protein